MKMNGLYEENKRKLEDFEHQLLKLEKQCNEIKKLTEMTQEQFDSNKKEIRKCIEHKNKIMIQRKGIEFQILKPKTNSLNYIENEIKMKENENITINLNLKPEYMWSNIDIMTSDSLPYIGKIDENLFIGTGYNTWGMTNSVLAGKVISDIITNYPNKYIELFDPKRINLSNVLGTVNNAFKSIEGLVNGMFTLSDKIEYKTINNKEIAIYKDNLGNHLVYTKCPHQGCKLLFNEIEKTWDCPCHASRFDIDGKCISGPANKDITVTDEDNTLPQEELVENIEFS